MSSPEPYLGERLLRQYSFGDFTLDVQHRVLQRAGQEVNLRAKSIDVLIYLVIHHGQLVTKFALMAAVWPDTAVTDNSLAQCMVEIRRALHDDSQQLIRTVARRGYLFTAPVTPPVTEFPREPASALAEPLSFSPRPSVSMRSPQSIYLTSTVALIATALALCVFLLVRPSPPARHPTTYTQITSFTDSVASPALSPDGRMVAFIRSDNWFLTPDQIYVKLLPGGEPVQITHDPRPKYGLSFSRDSSQIAYTVSAQDWSTYTVSPLGGEPRLLLANAAGLTWLDDHRVLFSERESGAHMGVVTSTENRSEYRKIYFPKDERGMAHLSFASPDRKSALVLEMNPVWQPCRVIPMDGSSSGRLVGPHGKCTGAAWSPDGKWMYLSVEVEGTHHLWRQHFPKGDPEQITSGLTEEEGVAVTPDGQSLITSIGMRQAAVWIHDRQGERPISSEGYVPSTWQSGLFGTRPKFSRDGRALLYLRHASPEAAIELWQTDIESGKSDNVVPGFSILEYDVSADGKEVVFSTRPSGKASQVWLATIDRHSPPRLMASQGEDSPQFGPDGQILYRFSDGKTHYIAQMKRDGSGHSKIASYAIGNIQTVSPDRRWIVSIMASPEGHAGGSMAVPIDGGPPRLICANGYPVVWSPDSKFLYVSLQRSSRTNAGKTSRDSYTAGQNFSQLASFWNPGSG